MTENHLKFIYFAGEPLGVPVLKELLKAGYKPAYVICNPDRPAGRGQTLTPPPVKEEALKANLSVFQPETKQELENFISDKANLDWDVFVVVAYNQILSKNLIETPKHGTLNLHPSLLPKLRGPSPVRSAVVRDEPENIGVSIIKLDEKMDHGPILSQEPYQVPELDWPVAGDKLEQDLAEFGGKLLANNLLLYIKGEIELTHQDHDQATYTPKLKKSDGELDLDPYNLPKGENAKNALLKIRAFKGFPGTFFMYEGKRIKVLTAHLENDQLVIDQIVPEGKKVMDFTEYFKT